ncbi:MAG: hypothetical protein ACFB6R_15475 [Alphaproteobacteria bacterium]
MESNVASIRDLIYSKYKETSPLVWLGGIAVGLALIFFPPLIEGLYADYLGDYTKSIRQTVDALGQALLSTGIIGIVFGQFTRRENFRVTELAIHSVLKEIMVPIRAELLLDAFEHYFWTTTISANPKVGDCIETWRQETNVDFRIRNLPGTIIIVGVTDSQLLKRYMLDDRCLLRWEIAREFHQDMKAAFYPKSVSVNGQAIPLAKSKIIGVGSGKILEYHFNIPSRMQDSLVFDVDFTFVLLRSVIPKSSHYIVPTIYKPSLRSRFRLDFDLDINPSHVTAHETGIFPLVDEQETQNLSVYDADEKTVTSHTVEMNFPVQRRSQILYELFFEAREGNRAETGTGDGPAASTPPG